MRKIKTFVEKYGLIKKGDRIITGVSGGADSVCLFFVLLGLREALGFELSAVVHVNHGIRGDDADKDEAFVQELCVRHQIPLEIFRVDLELIAGKRKQSLEEAGRMVRREAFESVRNSYGADKIALAHHKTDNVETFLWNLCRGTGTKGMGAIKPVSGKYIRPLLCMERKEIEQFLAERNQSFCEDVTNAETIYTRNKLRHLILPVLEEQINAKSICHIGEAIEQMWEMESYLEDVLQKAYTDSVQNTNEKDSFVIKKDRLKEYPPFIQRKVVLSALEEFSDRRKDWGQPHVRAVLELLDKQAGKRRNLLYGVMALRVYEGVLLKKEEKEEEQFFETPLQIPGKTYVPEAGISICCRIFPNSSQVSGKDIPQKGYTKWFDYDIIFSAVFVRTRKSGDTIAIDRAGHRKKLKSWLIDEKIPLEKRAHLPMIAEGNKILWIPGYRMGADYHICDSTKQILEITITEEKEDGRDS